VNFAALRFVLERRDEEVTEFFIPPTSSPTMTHLILTLALLTQDPLDAIDAKQGIKKAEPAPAAVAPAQPQPPGANDVKPNIPGFSDATNPPVTAANDTPSDDRPAGATDETASDDEPSGVWDWIDRVAHSGALGLMLRGGLFMWPILACGILAMGVIIERYRSLKMLTTDSSSLRKQVRDLLHEDNVEQALAKCDSEQGPVAAILSAGLRKYLVLRRLNYDAGKIEEQVVKGMDDYGIHVVAALEKHLPVLATISSVAPMLGFLGTVGGMVNSFDEIVASLGEKNIVEAAAAGIAEALLTTALGLIVGIPAFMAYNYFTGVINQFVLDVEESATELIETVTLQLAIEQQEANSPADTAG
jgi:biopolymer transport protein ExbB